MKHVSILLLSIGVCSGLAFAAGAQAQNLIPKKVPQALTPENFCVGVSNVLKTSTQNFKEEAAILCPGGSPSATLRSLISGAYQGTGQPTLTTLKTLETPETKTTQITVAYAMKLPKDAVQLLLGEEKHVPVPYQGDNLSISARFLAPPINNGEADTAFRLEQRTVVKDRVSFDDTSIHELRLYRMFPDNFDMMLAVRSLTQATEQFKSAIVMRGVMLDAQNPKQAYSISVLNFVMNSRDQHDRVVDAFMKFIQTDFMTLYGEQSKS